MYVRMCLRIYVCMRYARACKLTAWQFPPACPSRCLPVFARSVRPMFATSVSPVFATVSAALPADVIGFGKRRMMERKKKSKKRKSKKENNNNNIIN